MSIECKFHGFCAADAEARTSQVTAPIEPEAPRRRAKWAGLHEALSQLKRARALASENSGSAEALGAASDLIAEENAP